MIHLEPAMQVSIIAYLQMAYPWALVRGNARDSGKMSPRRGAYAKRLGQGKGWPDIEIREQSGGYGSLFLELKRDRDCVFTKGGLLRNDAHLNSQVDMLRKLRARKFWADFACSFIEAQEIIDWYLKGCKGGPPVMNLED